MQMKVPYGSVVEVCVAAFMTLFRYLGYIFSMYSKKDGRGSLWNFRFLNFYNFLFFKFLLNEQKYVENLYN